MSGVRFELSMPEGFLFEGDMQFVQAKVVVERVDVVEQLKRLFMLYMDNWAGGDYEDLSEDLPVKINGQLFKGRIVNMNQFGQLIFELSFYHNAPSAAPALEIDETPGQHFYVRTCKPEDINSPVIVEQGVMVHSCAEDIDGPQHGDHADAIVAFSYLVPRL